VETATSNNDKPCDDDDDNDCLELSNMLKVRGSITQDFTKFYYFGYKRKIRDWKIAGKLVFI